MVEWKGGEHGYDSFIVLSNGRILSGGGSSHTQMEWYIPPEEFPLHRDALRVYYNDRTNYLQITSHGPSNVPRWLLEALADRLDLKASTRVSFLGSSGVYRLGDLYARMAEGSEPSAEGELRERMRERLLAARRRPAYVGRHRRRRA